MSNMKLVQYGDPLTGATQIVFSKEIRKNREALIRHFYSLPKRDKSKYPHFYFADERYCLCAKGQAVRNFMGMFSDENCAISTDAEFWHKTNPVIEEFIDIPTDSWNEMEFRYEGIMGFNKHSYSQIADWLQTLPGWPRVL